MTKDIYLYIGYGIENLLQPLVYFSLKKLRREIKYMNLLIDAAKRDPYFEKHSIDLSNIKRTICFLLIKRAYNRLKWVEYSPDQLKYLKSDFEICLNAIMKPVLKFEKIKNSSK